MAQLSEWDIVAIAVYFIMVFAAGLYAMFRPNRGTVGGYFLAGRQMTWIPVGASLFASNIGSDHFIGLAGSGAAGGIGVGAFEMNAAIVLQILGWIFLPVFIASKASTLPEYMFKRFGGQRIRVFLSVLSMLLYIFTKVSVNLYAGALFIQLALGWNLYISIILILLMTAVCTITGGLAAVIYTDTLQTVVMLVGATILMVKSFIEVGGFDSLLIKYMEAVPNVTSSCSGQPRKDSWWILRDPIDGDIPWPGFIFGQLLASIWYWCTDQMMVQRALAAKSLSHAQGGTIFTGYLKFLPVFLIVIPGMISRVLFTDEVACADPDVCEAYCHSRVSCSNLAYPLLVLRLLPQGLRGVLMAVMLAALMSDLTSVFNSASTLFTIDIWQRFRRASTAELLIVGKVFVLVMVALSIAWIPVILQMQGGQLFLYIQAVSAYLSPPIATIYILAVFWKRVNEQGAFWGLIAGFSTGIVRMILDFTYPEPGCGEVDTRPAVIAKVHYMYFALVLFLVTTITSVIISYATNPPSAFMLIRTMYSTRFSEALRNDEPNSTVKSSSQIFAQTDGINEVPHVDAISLQEMGTSSTALTKTELTELPVWKKFLFWLCGYTPEVMADEKNNAMNELINKLSTLHQNPKAKRFLNINLVLIMLAEVVMFIFFTVGTGWALQPTRQHTSINATVS